MHDACKNGKRCTLDPVSRTWCSACRIQKCLNAGMATTAVRFGRMSKSERQKLIADKEELSQFSCRRISDMRTMSDDIKAAFKLFLRDSRVTTADRKDKIENRTCIINRLHTLDFHNHGIFTSYQQMIVPLMKAAVKFAKRIPSFTSIPLEDQIKLLKRGALAVAVIMMHELVGKDTIKLQGSDGEFEIKRSAIGHSFEAMSLLSHVILVSDRLRKYQLCEGEMALYCAIVLIADIPDTENSGTVLMDLLQAFRMELKRNHPKSKYVFPSLLVIVSDLRQIVDEFGENLRGKKFGITEGYANVLPLVKEITDVC